MWRISRSLVFRWPPTTERTQQWRRQKNGGGAAVDGRPRRLDLVRRQAVPWREATTHVLTHSLHYGLAVFEGVRAYKTEIGTAIFRLKEHTERLFNSAHIYMMKIPYTRERLMEAQREVVRANGLEACYIRPIAFYGSEKMGVSPVGAKVHVAIAAWPWGAYLGEALSRGHPRQDLVLRAPPRQRHHVRAPRCPAPTQLDPRQPGGDDARLRRGPAARRRRLRRRGRGREHLHRQERRALRARADLGADRHHPRVGDPARADLGYPVEPSASRATTSTSPTRRSSPAPPPRSRRSASSTAA